METKSTRERITQIEAVAKKVFGNAAQAKEWLSKKNIVLGASPISLMDTEQGAEEVRKVLSAIAHGGAV